MRSTNALKIYNDETTVTVNVGMEAQQNNKLSKQIEDYLQIVPRKITFVMSQISRATGIPESNLNLLPRKQLKINSNVEKQISDVLEALTQLADLENRTLKYCAETRGSIEFTAISEAICKNKYIGLITGLPGVGKTAACKYEARKNNGLYLCMDRLTVTLQAGIHKIEKETVGSCYSKVPNERVRRIIDYLKEDHRERGNWIDGSSYEIDGPEKIIFCDQSDYLSPDGVDLLRTISEGANIGLCLVGLPGILKKLNSKRAEVKQLKDRIAIARNLEAPSYQDICLVLDKNWPGLEDEIKKEFFKYSRKNYRILSHLIFHCREMLFTEENLGTELSVDHIQEAAGLLPKASDEEE